MTDDGIPPSLLDRCDSQIAKDLYAHARAIALVAQQILDSDTSEPYHNRAKRIRRIASEIQGIVKREIKEGKYTTNGR